MRRLAIFVGAAAALFALYWFAIRKPGAARPVAHTTAPAGDGAAPRAAPPGPQNEGEPGRAATLAVLMDDDPKGQLQLEGIVFDVQDKPVVGAVVALSANPPRTVTTGDDGTFAFADLVGRSYTVSARAASGVAGPVTRRLTAGSEPLVLRLGPGGTLTATVLGPDAKPIEGATVEVRDMETLTATTTKGVATFGPLVPGGYEVVAWAPGKAKAFEVVRIGVGPAEVKLVLQAGAAVAGRVVDDRGNGVAGARVRFAGASDWGMQADARRDAVESDATGAFQFAALPAGSFRFVATAGDFAPGTSALVTLDGKNEKRDVVITLAPGAVVRGTVVDTQKNPVAGARIRVGMAGRNRMLAEPPRQAFSGSDGSFEVRGLPRKELAIVAIGEAGSSETVELDATTGQVPAVTLRLDVTGTIAGMVVDATGQPLEGISVSAGPDFRDGPREANRNMMVNFRLRGFPEDLTDSGGRFTLTGLAPGAYTVTAARSAGQRRRGPGPGGNGTPANTGDQNLKIVLPADAAIKGRVQFADGRVPATYSVGVGFSSQAFAAADGRFLLEGLAPQRYNLNVRGAAFEAKSLDVELQPGQTHDAGVITVEMGRTIGGKVMAGGAPVAAATVVAGRQIFGSGSSAQAQMGPMNRGNKTATTGEDGSFSLSGFGQGDVTLVAESAEGRSKALVLAAATPGQNDLTLEIVPFGSLAGTLLQGGKPAEGVFVTAQSTTVPGSLYSVASGPDGGYRFDKLAPDDYKVSATLGMPMMGMRFYSKVATVRSGAETKVDLAVVPGSIAVQVRATAKNGVVGAGSVMMVSGVVAAATSRELSYRMAAAGAGSSQWKIMTDGGQLTFPDVVPGLYSICVVVLPSEIRGFRAMEYSEKYGDQLACVCKQVTVAAAPSSQSVDIGVVIPARLDGGDTGSGGAGPRGGGANGGSAGGGGNGGAPRGGPPGEGPPPGEGRPGN